MSNDRDDVLRWEQDMSDTSNNSGRSPSTTQKKPLSKVRRKQRETLFYRNKPDSEELAFAPPEVAEYVSAIHNAMKAPTWGQFKALIPPEEYERLLEKVRDGETEQDKVPSDDDSPFDPGVWFPEWYDGDHPDWIQQEQGRWLPESIIKRFAEEVDSVHNGSFWLIKSRSAKSIVRELSRMGFKVTRRDNLMFF